MSCSVSRTKWFFCRFRLLWDQSVASRSFTQQGAVLAGTLLSWIQTLIACCFEAPLFRDFGQNLQLEDGSLFTFFVRNEPSLSCSPLLFLSAEFIVFGDSSEWGYSEDRLVDVCSCHRRDREVALWLCSPAVCVTNHLYINLGDFGEVLFPLLEALGVFAAIFSWIY